MDIVAVKLSTSTTITAAATAAPRRRRLARNSGHAAITTATVNPAMAWLKVNVAATIMAAADAHHGLIRSAVHIAIANGTAAVSRHANIASDAVIARSRSVSPR